MIALQITDLKTFMNTLLKSETFDDFGLQEATLQMAISYVIDGHINKDFFAGVDSDTPAFEFVSYSEVRPTLFELIKGKRTPIGFQLVLQLSPERSTLLFPESLASHGIKSLLIIIRYDGTKAILTSGVNYATFTLDKKPEAIWDEALVHFLKDAQIAFEAL